MWTEEFKDKRRAEEKRSVPGHALLHVNVAVAADYVVHRPVGDSLPLTPSPGLDVDCCASLRGQTLEQCSQQQPSQQNQAQAPLTLDVHLECSKYHEKKPQKSTFPIS